MRNLHHDSKRVAKNTLYLYFRTLLVMGVSLFTSRVILDALGIENYGIYNVVGGFVSMFAVLSGTLTAGSQRFLAYEIGKKESDIQRIFSTTVTIHIVLAIAIFVLLESIGLWFLNYKMVIDVERMSAANWVFQCSVITFCINLISIPYNAAIIAHEKMSAFAWISIFEVIAKLACVYMLYVISGDLLIIYALSMLGIATILRLIYGAYCHRNFPKCRYNYTYSRSTFGEILNFCGWNFIGSTASVMNGQGINMLTNLFFGVSLNAARGIASQVDSAINSFVQNFMMALNPQITKSYAAEDYTTVNQLIIRGTKFAFFLFGVLCLPIFLNAEYILSIWLKQVPPHTCSFVRWAIIYTLCQTLSRCLYTTMLATGKIKKYQIVVGSLSLMAFPTAYAFFYFGMKAEYGYVAMTIFSLVCLIARLFLLKEMVSMFSPRVFVRDVLFRIMSCTIPVLIFVYIIHSQLPNNNFFTIACETSFCILLSCTSIICIGMTKTERQIIFNALSTKFKKNIR